MFRVKAGIPAAAMRAATVRASGAVRNVVTATVNPARFLDATDSLGTVEAGKLADLVLLDANPLADIRNAAKIRAVITDGRYLDRTALDLLLADARRAAGRLTLQ